MIRQEDDGFWVVMTETVAAHHEEVFAAFTTAGGLTRWFPVKAEIDCRTGGRVVFGWDNEIERNTTVAILNFDPGGTIVWDWNAARRDMHAPLYWTVEPHLEKGSAITLRQGPFAETTDALVAMAEECQHWRWMLCNLRTVYEAGVDMRKIRPL